MPPTEGATPAHADPDAPETAPEAAPITPADPAEVAPSENGLLPNSVLDEIRREFAEADADRRLTRPLLPGRWGGKLAVRFMPIGWDEQRKKVRQFTQQGDNEESELNYGATMIAKATECILIRTRPGGPLEPLEEAVDQFRGTGPVRFDDRFCKTIGLQDAGDLGEAEIVRLVVKNPQALNALFAELEAFQREAITDDRAEEDDGGGSPT